jgi:hypothetical protein
MQSCNQEIKIRHHAYIYKGAWKRIVDEFWELWNFPNCAGALHGKHVRIQAPPNSGSQFFNYKHKFSIVLFTLVDAQYNFVIVDTESFGQNSNGGIFANSKPGEYLEKRTLNLPFGRKPPVIDFVAPYVIVGDEAFPLKTYLMRPYPDHKLMETVKSKTLTTDFPNIGVLWKMLLAY